MNLLLITYEFPPKGGPGVQRPLQTARLLDAMGWDVTVLTVADPPTVLRDEKAAASVPPSVQVVRAWSAEPTRLLQFVRRLLGKERRATQRYSAGHPTGYSGASGKMIRFIQAFFLPDEKVGWTPWAVREARRLHAQTPFDVILASGPPFTAYRVAWKLSDILGIPWVADVRDPIVGNYFFKPPTRVHARYMRAFERRVTERASLILVATYGIARDIASRNIDATDRIITITNGFDPADFPGTRLGRDDRYFNVSYVGSFQGEITPDVFLDAVRKAMREDPSLHNDLRVRIVGPATPQLRETIDERGLAHAIHLIGFVPHATAVREMEAADVLLLVLADTEHLRATLTGKLPEYLGARRPILALVPDGAAREVLKRSNAARIVEPGDATAAAAALVEMHRQWRANALPTPDPVLVEEFDRSQLVARLSVLLEQVVSAANRSTH